MLKSVKCWGSRTMLMWKRAFICGSSKHGKAALAEVGSKCVVAMYLKILKPFSCTVLLNKLIITDMWKGDWSFYYMIFQILYVLWLLLEIKYCTVVGRKTT